MERLTLERAICRVKIVAKNQRWNSKYTKLSPMNEELNKQHEADYIKDAEEHEQIAEWLEELKSYKDLEEQGLLVRLPDDLKKKVYRITYEYTECSNFGETKNNCENYNCNRDCDSQKRFYIVENRLEFMLFCNYYHELGKTVFLTREEAKKKLEEIQNE